MIIKKEINDHIQLCGIIKREYLVSALQFRRSFILLFLMHLVNRFGDFCKAPKEGALYAAGGDRFCNRSNLKARELCSQIPGNKLNVLSQKAC